MLNLYIMESQVKDEIISEHVESFTVLKIKNNIVENLDFRSPNYIDMIMNINCFETIKTTLYDFPELLKNSFDFENNKFEQIATKLVHEDPECIYEIMYLNTRNPTVEKYNAIATILEMKQEQIFGNVLLLKTKISVDSDSMKFDLCSNDDLYNIFHNRKYHKCVIYEDGKWCESKFENLDYFVDDYFIDKPKKVEIGFLRHNLNIYYTKNTNGIKIGNLIDDKVDQCLIFSRMSDVAFNNITLDEVNKILKLSETLTSFDIIPSDLNEEKDSLGRSIIKNKYRILHNYFKKIPV
jgi:hypothetical protein